MRTVNKNKLLTPADDAVDFYDEVNLALRVVPLGMSIPNFDYISLTYTGANLTSVVYKTGGSGGATVAILTLAYSGSTLTSVTKT